MCGWEATAGLQIKVGNIVPDCMHRVDLYRVRDGHNKRSNITHVNIPGAFMQTDASNGTIIKLQGLLVITLLKINPAWKKIVYEGGKDTPTIYSKAKN